MIPRFLSHKNNSGPTDSKATKPAHRFLDARLLLSLVSIILLVSLYIPHRSFLRENTPYEAWDEVTVYNNAGSLMHNRVEGKAYAVYGMLDTAKYILARWFHERTTGAPHPVFSNNIESCLKDPNSDASGFGYARGIDDRRPFLIAREINLAFVYLLTGFTLVCAAWLYGKFALGIIACLLLALSSSGVLSQSSFALPNGPNAILAFSILFFSLTAVIKNNLRCLILASALLALGINHKFDFLIEGIITAIAALYFVFRDIRQPVRALNSTLLLFVVFAGTLLLTCPVSPLAELKNQINMVTALTSGAPNIASNFEKARFAMLQMFSPDSTAWDPVPWFASLSMCLLMLIALGWPFFSKGLDLSQRLTAFCAIALSLFAALAVPVIHANVFYGRYLVNGSTIMLAGSGLGLALLCRHPNRPSVKTTAWVLSFLLVALVGLRTRNIWAYHSRFVGRFNQVTKLDDSESRNRAIAEIISKAGTGGFSRKVLIDQHAYVDLRALRERGFEPILISMANYREKLDQLPPGKHLLLFVTGEYLSQKDWEGAWSEPFRKQYDAYLEFLKSLQVERDYPGNKMQLLSWCPPQQNDWMTLSQVERHPTATKQ